MVRPMRKTRAPTQSQRAIGHIAALQSIATMFVMHAMVGRSTLQFKMPRLDAYGVGVGVGVGSLSPPPQAASSKLSSKVLAQVRGAGALQERARGARWVCIKY